MSVVCYSIGNVSVDGTIVGNVVDALLNYSGRRREILEAVVTYEATLMQALSDAQAAAASVPSLQARIVELEEILNPPNAIWPNAFQALLTSPQRAALWNATDPNMIDMAVNLLTIASPMPFNEGTPLYNSVLALGQLLPDLFTEAEVARILARQAPE